MKVGDVVLLFVNYCFVSYLKWDETLSKSKVQCGNDIVIHLLNI